MAIESAQAIACDELVIKRGCAQTLVLDRKAGPGWAAVPTERVGRVIDTTAAGDAFAAGYLARRLAGERAIDAAAFGNRVAVRVIQHAGALIPREHMRGLTRQDPELACPLILHAIFRCAIGELIGPAAKPLELARRRVILSK